MAHEYFHSLQKFIAKRSNGEEIAPIWYLEGGAEYESYRVIESLSLANKDQVDKEKTQLSRGLLMPLSSMETKKGALANDERAVYALGYMATEFLALNFGEGTVARKFWETRSTVATWQEAFKATFGISIEEFYQRFEQYRAAQFQPYCGQVGEPPAADLAIQFVRRFPAGVTTIQDRRMSYAPNIGYVFCFKGMQFGLLDNDQQNAALVRPHTASGWLPCGGNCVIIYMAPSVSPGAYTAGITLSDGRHAENSFEHTLGDGTSTPTPAR